MALAMRAFAHERPGLSAATFRNSIIDSPEWRRESELLGGLALRGVRKRGALPRAGNGGASDIARTGARVRAARNVAIFPGRCGLRPRATAPLFMSLFEDWMYFGPLK
jgi:hypothetical protein